jgi:putative phosphonate metabolism protein
MLRRGATIPKMGHIGPTFRQREIMSEYQRYALYYAPAPQSSLGAFGNAWLGRDATTGQDVARLVVDGLDDHEIIAATTSPVRYGFHGTLKPPFALKDGHSRTGLEAAIKDAAAQIKPFACGPLNLKAIGRFLALVPTGPVAELGALAASLVRNLDDFRAPEDQAAMNKRRAVGLTDRQEAYLVAWGYPYVMEEFRFHLTLTNKLDADQTARFEKALGPVVAPLCIAPFDVADICLFGDPGDGKPFRFLSRFRLTG